MADRKDRDTTLGDAPEAGLPEDAGTPDPELRDDLGAEFDLRGDRLESALEEAQAEAARNLGTAQRVQAEFENFRKRMGREQTDAIKRAGERIVTELLPVLDSLERAIEHAGEGGEVGSAVDTEFLSGVRMVAGQLLDILGKEGVVQVDPLGEPFDANIHQAVGQKEDPGVFEGAVLEVYHKGYEMHGKTIRPAMVVVATGGPAREE